MRKNRFLMVIISIFISVIFLTSCSLIGTTDYASVVNNITVNKMSANIKIENKRTGYFVGGSKTDELIGSGVIIGKDFEDYYYALTNYHVVSLDEYSRQTLKTIDYRGNSHSLDSANILTVDKEKDLVLIKFYSTYEYETITISSRRLSSKESVFAVGYPSGQANAITIGKLIAITNAPKVENGSQLKDSDGKVLKVYEHSSIIFGGSSGGMLLDSSLKLVGINYAGIEQANGDFVCGYAIPSSVIIEFVKNTVVKDFVDII